MKLHRRVVTTLSAAAVTAAALVATAPAASANPYLPEQTQDSAEFTIANGYIAKQIDCTPDMPPVFDSITWNAPGFLPDGGSGMIHDANPDLGGPFAATWNGRYWDVEYQFC
jgi:hypothetical protein